MQAIDTLILAGHVVPVEPAGVLDARLAVVR